MLSFAMIALVLAGAGLYGVLAYMVTQRTTEIGIRIALGAGRNQVLQLVLADGLRPALVGLLMGLAGRFRTMHYIESILYQTKALDPAVFAEAAALLLAVAALACPLPVWRASRLDPWSASRLDPVQALRTE